MHIRARLASVVCVVLVSTVATQAHHGTSITYYADKSITLSGVVTEFVYGYPHPQIYFDVTDEAGKAAHWGSELAPTPLMMKNLNVGWSRDSIKAGDRITITCSPHKTPGATACLAREIQINGKLLALTQDQVTRAATAARTQ
jgi:hypothetical protein